MSERARLFGLQLRILARQPGVWLISTMLPLLSLLVFGVLARPEARAFDVRVTGEGPTALAASLDALPGVRAVTASPDESADAVHAGSADASIRITGSGLIIEVASPDPSAAAEVSGLAALAAREIPGLPGGGLIQAVDTVPSRRLSRDEFLAAGMVGLAVAFTNVTVGNLAVLWRAQGVLRRLRMSRIRPRDFIATQALAFGTLSLLQVGVILAVAVPVMGLNVTRAPLALAGTVVLGTTAMLGIGYALAAWVRSPAALGALANLVLLPMVFLSRSFFPVEFPSAVERVADGLPLTHLNDALRSSVTAGVSLGEVWPAWAILAGWGVAGFALSVRAFRWE